MTNSIRLGRLFAIPIGVQPAWLVIVALIGVAKMSGQPSRAADDLAFAAAGPAVTAVLELGANPQPTRRDRTDGEKAGSGQSQGMLRPRTRKAHR